MALTVNEKSWINAYRNALMKTAAAVVLRVVIFGSKARGDDSPDSDLDILVIIKDRAEPMKRHLRRIGYGLAATGEAVPSILVYTETEWESRRRSGSPFRREVERDEVRVL